jgi:hypothetical protein
MKTERWTFGSAAYFCEKFLNFGFVHIELIDVFRNTGFITFSSVGYGDLAPTTPAGRAIFVFWAFLGVGTMTILISSECSVLGR